jgi:hypothetical protein
VLIRLKREDASVLTEAANEMLRREPDPDFELEGLVTEIAEKRERFDGSAVLDTFIGGSVRRVRINFGESERELIYDAAKQKRWIRVVGELRREGQRLHLLNPRDIAVIEAEDADSDVV